MPDNEEQRKSVVGVVTPNATPDEDWRRQVAGVYSFGDGGESSGGSNGPVFSPVFSPVNPPVALLRALGLV